MRQLQLLVVGRIDGRGIQLLVVGPAAAQTGTVTLLTYPGWYGPHQFADFEKLHPGITIKTAVSGTTGAAAQIAQIGLGEQIGCIRNGSKAANAIKIMVMRLRLCPVGKKVTRLCFTMSSEGSSNRFRECGGLHFSS